jgi:hypothetical protein
VSASFLPKPLSSTSTAPRSTLISKQHPGLPTASLPAVHMFVDAEAVLPFQSAHAPIRGVAQPFTNDNRLSSFPLSPAGIVVSLQYALPSSRSPLLFSRCASKISVVEFVSLILVCPSPCRQAWWLLRQRMQASLAHRASMCFLRRLRSQVQSCIDDISRFLDVMAGLAASCALSRRDVSQCIGPFNEVLSCLSRMKLCADAGSCSALMR